MVFTFSISTLYDDDLVCMRQKPAPAHGCCILWLSTIGLQSCLGGAETCTSTWFLYPVVQRYRTMIELGSDKSCTNTWFLRSWAKTDMAALVSRKVRNLHKHMGFAPAIAYLCVFVCLSLSACLRLSVSVCLSTLRSLKKSTLALPSKKLQIWLFFIWESFIFGPGRPRALSREFFLPYHLPTQCQRQIKTCTGLWFLLPLAQFWLNLDVLGSGKSCTGSWFLHSASQRYMMMISSASDKNLHKHMVFASSGSAR